MWQHRSFSGLELFFWCSGAASNWPHSTLGARRGPGVQVSRVLCQLALPRTGMVVIFLSHQWLGTHHPDPEMVGGLRDDVCDYFDFCETML